MTKSARGVTKAQETNAVAKKAKHSNKDEKEETQEEGKDAEEDNATKLRAKGRKSTPTRVTMGRKDQVSPESVRNDNLDFEEEEDGEDKKGVYCNLTNEVVSLKQCCNVQVSKH
jgi:hypothetical protein